MILMCLNQCNSRSSSPPTGCDRISIINTGWLPASQPCKVEVGSTCVTGSSTTRGTAWSGCPVPAAHTAGTPASISMAWGTVKAGKQRYLPFLNQPSASVVSLAPQGAGCYPHSASEDAGPHTIDQAEPGPPMFPSKQRPRLGKPNLLGQAGLGR